MMEGTVINAKSSKIITINGGSSSIEFGLFKVSDPPLPLLRGEFQLINHVDGLGYR